MGTQKYRTDIKRIFEKSPVVSYATIERIVKDKKNVQEYVKKLIHYLLAKQEIRRLTKGYYTTRNEAALAVFAFQPAYLGLQDALSFHNLWEQETIPIIITTKKVRQGIRTILGQNVLIRRINPKYHFGIEYHEHEGAALPYSTIEKTFLDMIYYKETLSNEALKECKTKISKKKLENCLKKYSKRFREQVHNIIKDWD